MLKAILGVILLAALGIGGIQNFVPALIWIFILIVGIAAAVFTAWIGFKIYRTHSENTRVLTAIPRTNPPPIQTAAAEYRAPEPEIAEAWTTRRIEESLCEIDWYQFEKFCAAMLRSEGYRVERKGGAQPDGGVDLICEKDGIAMLIQCKHWRTWTVQEKTIRELLGSMTHFQVKRGALYTIKGWTKPAAEFAAQHGILLVDATELAKRAQSSLSDQDLLTLLNSREHHCPRCESRMIWRTGDFSPFWGCSTFPRCRGILKHPGAR
ncbi:MAG: restriction endonuclease [Nibricoccus sp.]